MKAASPAKWIPPTARESVCPVRDDRKRLDDHFLYSTSENIGCPSLGVAQPDPSNRIDYDDISSCNLSIHINTSLQSFQDFYFTQ
jgi:hypothetical protein